MFSDRLDEECGAVGVGGVSDLGSMCRHSCRGYNGCFIKEGEFEASERIEEAPPEPSAEKEFEASSTTTFVDMRGKERVCSWLDIRNWDQRRFRRGTNCNRLEVQLICPRSCESYTTLDFHDDTSLSEVQIAAAADSQSQIQSASKESEIMS